MAERKEGATQNPQDKVLDIMVRVHDKHTQIPTTLEQFICQRFHIYTLQVCWSLAWIPTQDGAEMRC